MDITAERQSGVQVLHVEGDLTAARAAQLHQVTGPLLARNEHEFVVNLSKATALDSAGLEALTRLERECAERLGSVRLCALNTTCENILRITRLTERFECHDTVDAAVASFG